MENENWNYGYVNEDKEVIVSQTPLKDLRILGGHFLNDVTLSFPSDSQIRITGKERLFDFLYKDTPLRDLDYGVDEDVIISKKVNNPIKYVINLFGSPIRYVRRGWVKTDRWKNLDLVLCSGWSLERIYG